MSTYIAPWVEWQRAVKLSTLACSKRPGLPILSTVRVDSQDGKVTLTATDLERWTVTELADAIGDGTALLPAHSVLAALKGVRGAVSPAKASRELVTVIADAGKVTVSGFGRSLTVDVDSFELSDFPSVPQQDFSPVADFASATLQDGTTFARVAAGKDGTLPALTGVLFDVKPSGVTLAATDRYRLAVTDVPATVYASDSMRLLVPAWALDLLTGMADVRLSASVRESWTSVARFEDNRTTVCVRLLDATFPTYERLIPDCGDEWDVNRAALAANVTAARAVLERNEPVRVTFDRDTVTVNGSQPVNSTRDARDGHLTAFNPPYLLDGLKAFAGESITVRATAATKPHVLTDDTGRIYLIMPVRLPAAA